MRLAHARQTSTTTTTTGDEHTMKTQTYQTRWNDDWSIATHASAIEALAHARALDTAVRIYGPDGELWLRIDARIDDGRKGDGPGTFPPEPGTLAHWLQLHGRIAFVYGAARVVPDTADDAATRALTQLSDYRVTSLSGGSFWLMPREGK
jgi:hypothetical protein